MDVDQPTEHARAASSGLQFQLHPLVLINISDHHTRTRANSEAGPGEELPVLGCLLGTQAGRTVDISNSFEMRYQEGSATDIDHAFLLKKMEQYKQTFPQQDVVGWYATGVEVTDHHMHIQRKLMEVNESPVFLRLDPKRDAAQKDLPVYLYESELHVVDGTPSFSFVAAKYTLETSEAERIGVDQVAKILPNGGAATGATQLSAHLGSLHGAIKMLVSRIALLHQLLLRMQSGELPYDHEVVRAAAGLTRRLPAVDSPEFGADYTTERNDTLLAVLLAALTRGTHACNDVVDKCNLAFERTSLKGSGRKGGGGMGSTVGLPMGIMSGLGSGGFL